MSSDEAFVSKLEADAPETNLDTAKEDRIAADSEATEEVEGLKDSLGGGQVLDDSEGYTRSSNKDSKPLQQEQDVDAAIDALE
ncbi:hypothetical protein BCR39DRAFT_558578 [Naematelia encephala]|uniref:Uncharacterized protein n=1 Tax=Naematelia encephala TaxID=71784 RepID=A0A1Y2B7C4_9TREE|nr:hypothetical protein BCR39DRAFT_558578 [Naematelia encephala]